MYTYFCLWIGLLSLSSAFPCSTVWGFWGRGGGGEYWALMRVNPSLHANITTSPSQLSHSAQHEECSHFGCTILLYSIPDAILYSSAAHTIVFQRLHCTLLQLPRPTVFQLLHCTLQLPILQYSSGSTVLSFSCSILQYSSCSTVLSFSCPSYSIPAAPLYSPSAAPSYSIPAAPLYSPSAAHPTVFQRLHCTLLQLLHPTVFQLLHCTLQLPHPTAFQLFYCTL